MLAKKVSLPKSSEQKFAFDVFIYGLTQVFVGLKGLFVLPVIAKILGATKYGIWSQVMVTISLLSPILTLRLEMASVRYLAAKGEKEVRGEFFSMLGMIWLATMTALGIIFFLGQQISLLLFNDRNLVAYVELIAVLLIVRVNYIFLTNYYRTFNQIRKYSLIQAITNIFEMGLLALLIIYMRWGLSEALIALITTEIAISIVIFIHIVKKIGFSIKLNFKKLFPYLKYSLPLIPNAALYWVIDSSDRYVIGHFLGLSSVGIYSASYSLARLITFFSSPISFVLFPTISKLWGQKEYSSMKKYCEKSVKYYLLFAIPAVFGICCMSPNILRLLTTKEFITSRTLILFISLGMFFVGLYQIYLYIIHLKEQTKYLPIIFLVVALFNLGLNFLLIPKWGIIGAAFSTFLSYALQFTAIFFLSMKFFPFSFDFSCFFKSLLASVIMFLVIKRFDPESLGVLVGVAFVGAAVYFAVLVLIKGVGLREWHLAISLIKKSPNNLGGN